MTSMSSREIIRRIISHDSPPRIGFDFIGDNPRDILSAKMARVYHPDTDRFSRWNREPELLARVPGFSGEVRLTPMGNIFGRLGQKTQGECIKGALEDGWHRLEQYTLPLVGDAPDVDYSGCGQYVLGGLPCGVFSALMDSRRADNALIDTALEADHVSAFLDGVTGMLVQAIDKASQTGIDGLLLYDDLGTQHALFFSPDTFRRLLKPCYKRLADELHSRKMDFFVHSCGNVFDVIGDFIEIGVDVFQFDQPELSGSDVLAENFGTNAAFYCPVDIQKIMASGNRSKIEEGALNMANCFKKQGGSLIAMDYGNWQDLNVLPEWQQWARDVLISNAWM